MNFPRLASAIQPIKADSIPLSDSNYQIWTHCLATVERQRKIEQNLQSLVKKCAESGDYAEAIALLTQLIHHHPDIAVHYNNRGLMYFYDQQLMKAIHDYNLAIALDPILDRAYNNRGNCYVRQGKLFAALRDYQIALDLNPWNGRALINLGITYRELGDYPAAIAQFDTAFSLRDPHHLRIYGERGYTHYLNGDWNAAIADYRRVLRELPSSDYRDQIQYHLDQLLNFPEIGNLTRENTQN